ncbi:MAG: hypothetical protein M0R03_10335 [Novosphingobium sp.]|nr:hypothetical protein [Novosphingobium sp.]
MEDSASQTATARPGAPLLYWIIAVLAVLWNAFGGYDYTMTNLRDSAYLANFPPEMMAMIDAMPTWTRIAWAVGVWGAVVGSLLMLIRSRHAVTAFALSLLGLAVSTVHQVGTDMPASLETPVMRAMMLVVWVIAVGLLLYTWRMQKRGVLR